MYSLERFTLCYHLHERAVIRHMFYTAASLMTSHVMLEDSPSPVKGLQCEMIFTIPPFQEDYLGSKNLQFALISRSDKFRYHYHIGQRTIRLTRNVNLRFLKKPNFLISWVRIFAPFLRILKRQFLENKKRNYRFNLSVRRKGRILYSPVVFISFF